VPCEAVVGGDRHSYVIAAASIIAKVSFARCHEAGTPAGARRTRKGHMSRPRRAQVERDLLMDAYDKEHPQYGFRQHKVRFPRPCSLCCSRRPACLTSAARTGLRHGRPHAGDRGARALPRAQDVLRAHEAHGRLMSAWGERCGCTRAHGRARLTGDNVARHHFVPLDVNNFYRPGS